MTNPQATNLPTIFNYSNHQVRTLTHDDGAIWFVARDVFKSLTIPWAGKRTLDILDPSWSMVVKLTTTHKNQHGAESKIVKDTIFINEPAVYKLAFRSNKPEADKFTNWVASEVLPSIRKTGAYTIPVQQLLPETLIPSEQHELFEAVKTKSAMFRDIGKVRAEIWSRIHNKFKVAKYDQLPRTQLHDALNYVEQMEVKSSKQIEQQAPAESLEVGLLKIRVEALEMKNHFLQQHNDCLKMEADSLRLVMETSREMAKELADKLDELAATVPAGINYYMKESAVHMRGQNKLIKDLLKELKSAKS